ncbi:MULTISPECIES: type II toxin-antitoxin system YafO family toxin [Acinetobacter]|uniref:Type II toxin-antitoxin system YafO family toxin n=1 Tax=Acinetobacter genomosp. 15BJ TaxID=106651 RepID=R9BB90_9GAMM|nr:MULTISPECIES: type II toxin-antitoxin system YafO family toxin [Acinetobacter]EOR09651.1 hypothetical protein F896_00673 [Acinetobacter genomosp. 15BJ]MCH7293076.1 type II toxin-antitoxin system YafO family toxin [Acinetobacter genomosp. 15BJ]MCI3879259.1 type II toxin-antitoxin system YafO family toxin [Acinetobacter higginsii]MDO3657181.1 type II toxin-antitoxin system YafO family toxin [Acinetobacter genomosp. 15BJ]
MQQKTFIFTASEKLSNHPDFKLILEEFESYKKNSNDKEHPRPVNHIQRTTASVSYYFGRDRFDIKHKQARAEEIQHVHFREENSLWEFDDGDPKAQWDCKSNTYLIYSYFYHNNCHYYFLIDLIEKNAHNNDNAIYIASAPGYLAQAQEYKSNIINPPPPI